MSPRVGEEFVAWDPPGGGDRGLGIVDFAMFPHLDNPGLPWNTIDAAEQWAAGLDCPTYAMDDETAIRVVDGAVDVVSEGTWKQL
jgi:dipeptidase E